MSHGSARRRGRDKVYTGFVNVLPKELTQSKEMLALPPGACKLLLAILPQFNGRGRTNGGLAIPHQSTGPGGNSGALMILMRQPQRYGFRSVETLTRARNDLLAHGFIQIARQGGRHQPSLYALTWEGIDHVPNIDVRPDPKP